MGHYRVLCSLKKDVDGTLGLNWSTKTIEHYPSIPNIAVYVVAEHLYRNSDVQNSSMKRYAKWWQVCIVPLFSLIMKQVILLFDRKLMMCGIGCTKLTYGYHDTVKIWAVWPISIFVLFVCAPVTESHRWVPVDRVSAQMSREWHTLSDLLRINSLRFCSLMYQT